MNKGKAELTTILRTRVSDEIGNLLKAKAFHEKKDISNIVREIIIQYFENSFSDSTLLLNNMNKLKQKINSMDNKLELMSVLVIELTKLYTVTFPDKTYLTEELQNDFYENLIKTISENMKNHKGKIESMILDIYEQSE